MIARWVVAGLAGGIAGFVLSAAFLAPYFGFRPLLALGVAVASGLVSALVVTSRDRTRATSGSAGTGREAPVAWSARGRRTLSWALAWGMVVVAAGGTAIGVFALFHAFLVAFAPAVLMGLPFAVGISAGLAWTHAEQMAARATPLSGPALGLLVWLTLVPPFAVLAVAAYARTIEEGPQAWVAPLVLAGPAALGLAVGFVLTRRATGAIAFGLGAGLLGLSTAPFQLEWVGWQNAGALASLLAACLAAGWVLERTHRAKVVGARTAGHAKEVG